MTTQVILVKLSGSQKQRRRYLKRRNFERRGLSRRLKRERVEIIRMHLMSDIIKEQIQQRLHIFKKIIF